MYIIIYIYPLYDIMYIYSYIIIIIKLLSVSYKRSKQDEGFRASQDPPAPNISGPSTVA